MTQADLRTDPRTRWTVVAIVILIHVGLVIGLIRAFTPQFPTAVANSVTRVFTVAIPAPPPKPAPPPGAASAEGKGSAGASGRKAKPRADLPAPPAKVAIGPLRAPPVQGHGDRDASGGRDRETGSGASGVGQGVGSGTSGVGQGGGGVGTQTVKIAGDINSARDYPRASRDLRIGASVTIDLAVGVDGRVKACHVVQPSPDAEADRITCELAISRFRFRPATDSLGNPAQAIYRWRQRWFY